MINPDGQDPTATIMATPKAALTNCMLPSTALDAGRPVCDEGRCHPAFVHVCLPLAEGRVSHVRPRVGQSPVGLRIHRVALHQPNVPQAGESGRRGPPASHSLQQPGTAAQVALDPV